MGVAEAFIVGAVAGAYLFAGYVGLVNCDAYQKWEAEREVKNAIYTFAAVSGDAVAPELPEGVEIVIASGDEPAPAENGGGG